MNKRILVILLSILMLFTFGIGMTYAMLVSKSPSLVNSFVVGNIELTLTESTGSNYKLVPGTVITKDPKITVKSGSEACWLFFKLESDDALEELVTYSISSGWTALAGEEGVYYRPVAASGADREYSLLSDNRVTVKTTATEDKLMSFYGVPKMIFYAYAIQYEGISTPEAAWSNLMARGND